MKSAGKSLPAALSDIAAMGGTPQFGLVGLACPGETEVHYIEEVFKGINNVMSRFGSVIVGGDTSRSSTSISLDVTVIGTTTGSRYLRRGGALTGDALAVTGWLGQSAAGLHAFQHGTKHPAFRISHAHPRPRIAEGQWLARKRSVHAAIDISDGLLRDTNHMAKASRLGINIHSSKLPVSESLSHYCGEVRSRPAGLCSCGGAKTMSWPSQSPRPTLNTTYPSLAANCAPRSQLWVSLPTTGTGVRIDGKPVTVRGFEHFRSA